MNIEPSDVDNVMRAMQEALLSGFSWLLDACHRWYSNRTAPYYQPPQIEEPLGDAEREGTAKWEPMMIEKREE